MSLLVRVPAYQVDGYKNSGQQLNNVCINIQYTYIIWKELAICISCGSCTFWEVIWHMCLLVAKDCRGVNWSHEANNDHGNHVVLH